MVRPGRLLQAAQPARVADYVKEAAAKALGSASGETLTRIKSHLSPAVAHFTDAIPDHGQGTYVYTTDGRKFLDMACGIGVTSTGHSHPAVVKAIQDQAASMIFAQQNVFPSSKPLAALIDELLEIMPKGLTRFAFQNSGSESVENAIKIARAHTKRKAIIAFENSFHGRTYGAMALTTSKTYYRQGFGPFMPEVYISPYPYCLHCKARQLAPGGKDWYKIRPNIPPAEPYEARVCCNGPMEGLKSLLKQQVRPEETAAIIVEPIMGEGGFLTPPASFFQTVRQLCDEHGIMLILDEVQAGVGRTGKWWGHQHVLHGEPDIMCFAKGIASGFPFAGVAAKPHIMEDQAPGTIGGTYGAGPLGAAAAVATLQVIKEEQLLSNATARGSQLVKGLVKLSGRYPIIDIRGRGLMVAVEFGGKDGSFKAETGTATAMVKACAAHSMLLLSAGAKETVRFLPPLNVSEDEIASALSVFEASLEDIFGKDAVGVDMDAVFTQGRAGS